MVSRGIFPNLDCGGVHAFLGAACGCTCASGPPRCADDLDWQLLQHTVAAFSTFLFVFIVLEVQHELGLCDQVVVLSGLLSVFQAFVLVMFCLVNTSKVFWW